MDSAQKLLYGRFPRAVGSPEQHMVHSEKEFDLWARTVQGRRNAYSTLSWFKLDGTPVCDKVSFDFDAPKDAHFDGEYRDDEKIAMMRDDPRLAVEVLGDVCRDVRKLARRAGEEDIPVVGVFSGFGVHVHLLFQPEENPAEYMGTTARYYRDELGLVTLDPKPIGDQQRIMRVPNMERVHLKRTLDYTSDRWQCNLWTIPLSREEMETITPEVLLELSESNRSGWEPEIGDERSAMPFYEDYTKSRGQAPENDETPQFEAEYDSEGELHWVIKELVQMPCMYENLLLDPEPPQEVRFNSAVLLFNLGMKPGEVTELFSQLNWRDWDRELTEKYLNQIYKKGYSDMNCETLRHEGFCRRTDNPEDCPAFGWQGGEPEWKA